MCHLLVVRKEYSIRLDRWHKTKAKRQLTNVYWHIFFCRGDVVTSFSGIINNYLERKIPLKFYTTVFSLICGTFSTKRSEFFYYGTYSVLYKHSSINLVE